MEKNFDLQGVVTPDRWGNARRGNTAMQCTGMEWSAIRKYFGWGGVSSPDITELGVACIPPLQIHGVEVYCTRRKKKTLNFTCLFIEMTHRHRKYLRKVVTPKKHEIYPSSKECPTIFGYPGFFDSQVTSIWKKYFSNGQGFENTLDL